MFSKNLLFLLFVSSLFLANASVKETVNEIVAKAQTYSCLNPKDPDFLKICRLTFFPPSTNITADVRLTSSKDLLLTARFPTFDVAQLSEAYFSPTVQKLAHLLKFDTISLADPTLYVVMGLMNQAVRFSTEISIFALQNVTFDLIVK